MTRKCLTRQKTKFKIISVEKRKVLYLTKDKVLGSKEEIVSKKLKSKSKDRFIESLSLVSNLGFTISIPIAGGAFLGDYLDDKFASSPKITLSLIFLGMILGIVNVYHLIKQLDIN